MSSLVFGVSICCINANYSVKLLTLTCRITIILLSMLRYIRLKPHFLLDFRHLKRTL